jgi:hypothetical protein
MTDKAHLCDLQDDNDDFKATKWPRGVGRHGTKRRGKGCANSLDSDRAQAGSTEHSDTEQTTENKRKPSTKHNWIACKDDAGVGPRIFQGFAAAFAYMHQTFAVAGCEGMSLVDKGGDTTKHSVVYRYACAFHNYIRCPFVVRIRVLVCSVTFSRTFCFFFLLTNCQSHTTLWHMW